MATLTIMTNTQAKFLNENDEQIIKSMLSLVEDLNLSDKQKESYLKRMSTLRYNAVTGRSSESVANFGLTRGSSFLGVKSSQLVYHTIAKVTHCDQSWQYQPLKKSIKEQYEDILNKLEKHTQEIGEALIKLENKNYSYPRAKFFITARIAASILAIQYKTTYEDIFLNYHLDVINHLPEIHETLQKLYTK